MLMSNVWGRQKPCSVLFCSLYIVRVRVKKTERISMVCPIFPMNLDIGCVLYGCRGRDGNILPSDYSNLRIFTVLQ